MLDTLPTHKNVRILLHVGDRSVALVADNDVRTLACKEERKRR